MKFEQIEIHNLGPFADRTVNFHDLPGPLIAVCGRNGAGKSTFLELLLGAMWRECPTRGPLIGLATARDAFVAVKLEHGGRHYVVKQLVDSVNRKGEALITNGDGLPLVESTKVSAVDAYVEHHFPALDVLLVSTFASQQSQGFIDARPGDRKALLLRILGIERLEELAASARAQANLAERELTGLRGQLKQETDRNLPPLSSFEEVLELQRAAEKLAEQRVTAAKEARANGEAQHADSRRATDAQAFYFRERNKLEDEAQDHTAKVVDVETRLVNNRKLTARTAEIETACAQHAAFDLELRDLDSETGAIVRMKDGLTASLKLQRAKRRDVDAGRLRAAETARRRPEVDAAKRSAVAYAAAVEETEGKLTEQRRELEAVAKQAAASRIGNLRIGLAAIRDSHSHIDAARDTAGKTLERDTAAASAASRAPTLAVELNQREMELRTARGLLEKAQRVAADEALVVSAEEQLTREVAELGEIDGNIERDAAEESRLANDLAVRISRAGTVRLELGKLAAVVKLEPPLRVAAARIEDLERQAAELETAGAALERRRAELGEPPPAPVVVNLPALRQQETDAERDHRDAMRQIVQAESGLAQARDAAARRAALEEKIGAASAHHGDWVLLSRELGKDGLQATLIDAALPELQALTNSLLHQNFGPRFTVEVRSQAADSKGKRLLETLDVVVLDSENGREAPVETYSGGERAIIGEGLSLALTTLASRESGLTGATLIRDEAGAALDAANGRAWIAMLRQAARVMGADRLLFVSHSKELAELADSRIDL